MSARSEAGLVCDVVGEVTVCRRYEEVMISMESEIIDLLRVSCRICHRFSSEFIQICDLNVVIMYNIA